MRSAKPLYCVAFATVITLLVLNWQAQRDTRHQLDRLAGSLAVRAEPPAPPAIPRARPETEDVTAGVAPEPAAVPRGLNRVKHPAYVIEPPDMLLVQVVVRDPATNAATPLPVQAITGSFLVRPDGTIGLGVWGDVSVAGLTTEQTADAVRQKVSGSESFGSLKLPPTNLLVVVDVHAFNSKRYYIITDGEGSGEQVVSLPVTGNETVLDAVANIHGLPGDAAKRTIRLARRSPVGGVQSLAVDWAAITQQGDTATNYQLLPGDRLYVTAKK